MWMGLSSTTSITPILSEWPNEQLIGTNELPSLKLANRQLLWLTLSLDSFEVFGSFFGVGWLLCSQVRPHNINATKSKTGPILGSPNWLCIWFMKEVILYFKSLLEEIIFSEPACHKGSESSGTSSGHCVLCKMDRILHCQKDSMDRANLSQTTELAHLRKDIKQGKISIFYPFHLHK